MYVKDSVASPSHLNLLEMMKSVAFAVQKILYNIFFGVESLNIK